MCPCVIRGGRLVSTSDSFLSTRLELEKNLKIPAQTKPVCSAVFVPGRLIHRVIRHSYRGLLINVFEPGRARATKASSRSFKTPCLFASPSSLERIINRTSLCVCVCFSPPKRFICTDSSLMSVWIINVHDRVAFHFVLHSKSSRLLSARS